MPGWHSALLFWAGFLPVTGIIPEYFSQMTGNDPTPSVVPLSLNAHRAVESGHPSPCPQRSVAAMFGRCEIRSQPIRSCTHLLLAIAKESFKHLISSR